MLHFRRVGQGQPLVIVHGLFGSGDNWLTLAGKFPGYEVILPDLRNHGQSPWSPSFTHTDLANDLYDLHQREGWGPCPWIGHSLGGKAVMELALTTPAVVEGLAVLDILPKAYPSRYPGFVEALRGLDLASLTSRSEAQARLEASITDKATLQFLLKSLVNDPETGWRWRLNLEALENQYPQIWKALELGRSWDGPTLFLYGAASDYYAPGDEERALTLFPLARFESIAGAGHWLHAEKPAEVVGALNHWLGDLA